MNIREGPLDSFNLLNSALMLSFIICISRRKGEVDKEEMTRRFPNFGQNIFILLKMGRGVFLRAMGFYWSGRGDVLVPILPGFWSAACSDPGLEGYWPLFDLALLCSGRSFARSSLLVGWSLVGSGGGWSWHWQRRQGPSLKVCFAHLCTSYHFFVCKFLHCLVTSYARQHM